MKEWPRVRSRRIFSIVQGGTPTADEENWNGDIPWATPVDLAGRHGGYLDSTARSLTETGLRTGSRAVPADSLVLSTRAPIGYVAQNTMSIAFNQGCKALVPRTQMDIRYFRYQFSVFAPMLAGMGQGSTFMELSRDALGDFLVYVPPEREQRVIADYLDRETARIDALVTKKKEMLKVINERAGGLIEVKIRDLALHYGETRLKFAVKAICVGIVITPAAWYTSSGVLAIRGVNVRPWRFDLTDVVYLTEEGHALHRKSELTAGDVVVVRTGQAGAAAVVPPELEGSNCIDLLIIRPGSLLPHYLAYVLNSDWTTKHIAQYSVGTIQSHFNVGSLKDLPVPIPPLEVQEQQVATLDHELRSIDLVTRRLECQIQLLKEHRQALIAAVATGQMEIPAVA